LFACVEIVETLKQQLASKDAQLTAAQQQNVAQSTQLAVKDTQLATQAAEIQLLKSKLFQQSSSA